MNYLERIISEARVSATEYFNTEMESFYNDHQEDDSVDFLSALAKTIATSQKQNVKILYQVLDRLSKDGYLNLPENDEHDDVH